MVGWYLCIAESFLRRSSVGVYTTVEIFRSVFELLSSVEIQSGLPKRQRYNGGVDVANGCTTTFFLRQRPFVLNSGTFSEKKHTNKLSLWELKATSEISRPGREGLETCLRQQEAWQAMTQATFPVWMFAQPFIQRAQCAFEYQSLRREKVSVEIDQGKRIRFLLNKMSVSVCVCVFAANEKRCLVTCFKHDSLN